MGVPVVTLAGDNMVGRWSASMLRRIGLWKCVAHSPEDYIQIVEMLTKDLNELERLRYQLRNRVAESPLCNAKMRARQLERSFSYMWKKWCHDQPISNKQL